MSCNVCGRSFDWHLQNRHLMGFGEVIGFDGGLGYSETVTIVFLSVAYVYEITANISCSFFFGNLAWVCYPQGLSCISMQ